MANYNGTSKNLRSTTSGEHKTEYSERSYSPAEPDEIDLSDELWLEELQPIIPEKQPERYVGQHVLEKPKTEISIERLLEEGMQQMEEGKKKDSSPLDPMNMGTRVSEPSPQKRQIQQKNPIKPVLSEDSAPKGEKPSLLMLVLEIICGFSILLAAVSTIIAWHVFNMRTGGW